MIIGICSPKSDEKAFLIYDGTLESAREIEYWTENKISIAPFSWQNHPGQTVLIANNKRSGRKLALRNDYIIKGRNNEFYIFSPWQFEKRYVAVETFESITALRVESL